MGVDLHKTSHVLFFVVFLPAVSFGIGWLFAQAIPHAPFWVETISPLAAYGLLFGFFDKVVWHWPIFRWLGIVGTPDVRGRWLGEQVSSFRDENGKNRKSRVMMEVTQTFSHIEVHTYYHNWQSTHTAASCWPIDGQVAVVIMFESEPKAAYEGNAMAHKGVIKLFEVAPGRLTGSYFNANGHYGELSFRRTRFTLHHTFEAVGRK
ncbi:MAG TPA: hypothetical protein VFZ58_01195 [Candidatus Saccharimonadales bacterium]